MKLCSLQSAASFHFTMQGEALGGLPGCCQESGFSQSYLGQGRGKVGQLMLWVLSPELPDFSSLFLPPFRLKLSRG